MNKAYNMIDWINDETPINQTNLNKMSTALNTIDDRVVSMNGTLSDFSDSVNKALEASETAQKAKDIAISSAEKAEEALKNAEAITGVGIATSEKAGLVKADDILIETDGTLRFITTTDQTTLPNSHTGRVKFNSIVGGMEQASTEGNQLLNLHDAYFPTNITVTKNEDNTVTTTNTTTGETSGMSILLTGTLLAGNYTLSNFASDGGCYIMTSDDDYSNFVEHNKSKTFLYDGNSYLRILYVNQPANSTRIYKMMLNAGTTALPWEPYTNGASPNPQFPQPINGSVIEKVRVQGEQLFDASATPYQKSHEYNFDKESGDYAFTSPANYLVNRWIIKVKSNTDVALTAKEISSNVMIQISNVSLDGTIDARLNSGTLKKTINTLNFTELLISIFAFMPTSSTLVANGIMLSYNADATYEPYQSKEITLSNPITLYGDVLRQNVERKRKKVVFDGSNDEVWVASPNVAGRYNINVPDAKGATLPICSHAKSVAGTMTVNQCYINSGLTFYINTDVTIFATVDDWKAYLAEKPMTVVYESAESVIEELPTADKIALNSLPTYDGITYVEFVNVGVQPSVSLDYGTSKVGGMTLEGLLAGINGELQSQLNNDRITALESAVVNNV